MISKNGRGSVTFKTSQKNNPSVYDDYKEKKGSGVITIGKQLFYFSNNRELKKIMKLKKSLLVA
jgi:hypothetical protein|tara:strand:+ start:441 stop:632 length:192 start_codon:yes stop_codon:yes gene_type:complete